MHHHFTLHYLTGTNLSKSSTDCMYQLQMENFRGKDGLFAVIDGGKHSNAAVILNQILAELVEKELQLVEGSEKDSEELVYLKHAFLTAHRSDDI